MEKSLRVKRLERQMAEQAGNATLWPNPKVLLRSQDAKQTMPQSPAATPPNLSLEKAISDM